MIERVKLLMSVKNLSSAQLAEIIGVQRSGISHILSGRNKPSLDFVLKVIEAYPDLNESWLLKGEGEMLKGDKPQDLFVAERVISSGEVVKPIVDEPLQVENEVAPYYKPNDKFKGKPEPKISAEEKFPAVKNTAETVVNPKESTLISHALSKEIKNKKLIKLIAIYNDDSFKIYHAE